MGDAALQSGRPPHRLCPPEVARRPTVQSSAPGGGLAGLVVQHRRELRHQHELARLRRRVDDELPHADARADGAELRLRGVGHGHPRCARAWARAKDVGDHRELLGGSGAEHDLHPGPALLRVRDLPGLPGSGADVRRLSQRQVDGAGDRRRRPDGGQSSDRGGARSLAESPSRISERTAAASSTRTPPTRSRTRRRYRTSSSCSRSS